MKILPACLVLGASMPVVAHAWSYSSPLTVNEVRQPRTFQHLESSGNRSIAISKAGIAVTWEDNRSGKSQVYVAFKALHALQFSKAMRVSDVGPAYEPALAGLQDGRFLVVWEAKARVWSRIVSPQGRGAVQLMSQGKAREATVTTTDDGRLWLAWAQQAYTHYQIVASTASVSGDRIQLAHAKPVDAAPPKQDQQYPTIALTSKGATIAWEDRRYGHTRLFTAFAENGKWFSALRQLNYIKPWSGRVFGKGTGAMRVVLASDGKERVVACWLDKRDFVEGYDVYSAFSRNHGKTFGRNEKVEDMLGGNQAQWHAVSAMDSHGHGVVAWDDQRDGSPDVWLSWHGKRGWSDDESPAGANGKGRQTHPALLFDKAGRLHMVFLEQRDGASAIRYLVATPSSAQFDVGP